MSLPLDLHGANVSKHGAKGIFKRGNQEATKRERADVAVACSDSVSYLYQIAGEHRYASPFMATQIERYTRVVADLSDGRLETVPRASMVRHPEIFYGVLPSIDAQEAGGNDDDT